jgi:hypothetical protein
MQTVLQHWALCSLLFHPIARKIYQIGEFQLFPPGEINVRSSLGKHGRVPRWITVLLAGNEMKLGRQDNRHNDTRHNDIRHNIENMIQ